MLIDGIASTLGFNSHDALDTVTVIVIAVQLGKLALVKFILTLTLELNVIAPPTLLSNLSYLEL